MGKLIRLELFNFKSYKGHHVLPFGDSYFTSIIGPNGSGKSNSMDAISFVLGIKSAHLRSSHLRDLIYRGRVLQHAVIDADGTATDGAQVAAGADDEEEADTQASSQRNDPTTAWVMAVYEDDAGEEQAWKRSITAKGASEYRLNNRAVTAQQYNEALEAEQILIKARNFLVFQGDVEAIASQSSKDLTRLIEQICGSSEYKQDYDRLKLEADKAAEDQQFKLAQRRGINSEIKQYQEQKREADSYARKQDELDGAVVKHVLWKLHHFQRTIDDSTEEIQKHQDELKEFRRNVSSYEAKLNEAKRDQAKVGGKVAETERNIKRKDKDIEDKENSLLPINEKISLSEKKLSTSAKRVAEIARERDGQAKTAELLRKDLFVVQRAQARWEEEWRVAQQQSGRELNDADLQEYSQLRTEVSKQTSNDQIQADNLARQVKTAEETVNSLKSKIDSTQNLMTKLDSDIADLRSRREELGTSVKSTAREIDAKKKDFNAMTSERLRVGQKHRELEEKLTEVLNKLSDANASRHESEKEARVRETVSAMKRIFPGVRGQLWTLCKPKQKKYNVAVSTVLGRHHDSIVVDTEATAKDCIKHLREQRSGQATFIPLDTIMHKAPDANLKGMHPQMRLAVDTIDYDNAIERAVSYACGNSIVCDTLAVAKHLVYERHVDAKAVTIDGTIIHKAGLMTGGQGPDQRNARKWEDAEVDNLRQLQEKFIADIAALPRGHQRQAEEEALQGELSGLEARRTYAEDELKALDRNIDSKRKELRFAQGQLADIEPRFNDHSRGLTSLQSELDTFKTSVASVEDRVFAAFCQRLNYPNIRAYEAQQGTMQQEAAQKKLEFTTQRSRLENQLSFETQRLQATSDRITRLENESADAQRTVESLEAERDGLNTELDTINAEREALAERLSTLKAKNDEKAVKVAEHRREVTKRSKSIDATTKAIVELEAEMSQANLGRFNTLKRCRMEKIDIPLLPDSRRLDSLPQVDHADADAMEVDGEEDTMPEAQDYGISVDFDDLDDDLKDDSSDKTEKLLQESIAAVSKELESMAPNARANERLESTEARLADYETQFEQARAANTKAKREFERVRAQRLDLFTRAYDHISNQIDQVYKDLTRTSSFPLGGMASLSLEDDDEPYLYGVKYHAMPPLKRFRDMEHLSGGEKTMAALALLFAIHTYAPSPFFVLDEVDAALDNANTARLANYVKEHARPGMQFVVISLKTGLFQNSETLVGVMRDQGINSSRALTLDLRKYQAV